MLTARFAAFLLEPNHDNDRMPNLATALELLATAKRANGLAAAKQWQMWALAVRAGKVPRAKFVQGVLGVMDGLRAQGFSGDPAKDWTRVKIALRAAGDEHLTEAAKNLDYLVAFNRGKRISGGLGAVWMRDGQYTGARQALDLALAQDQILGGVDDPPGVQVMNVHRAKGKAVRWSHRGSRGTARRSEHGFVICVVGRRTTIPSQSQNSSGCHNESEGAHADARPHLPGVPHCRTAQAVGRHGCGLF